MLQQLAPGTQRFLLQTSILNRLSAELCDAICFAADERPDSSEGRVGTKNSRSQEILESLEAANLFLLPLDNDRRWYRYHHLFSDLLTHRLRQACPEQIAVLHHRASDWYEKEGYLEEAIRHAQAAGDSGRLVSILEKHWQRMPPSGLANMVLADLQADAGETTEARKNLAIGRGHTK